MSSVHPARRRADRFDAAIEASSTAEIDPRLLELVELVDQLRSAPPPLARDAFVSDLRTSLLLAAETDLVPARPAPVSKPRRSKRERRIAVALGGFAIVGATTSMAVAAQSALPGDVLYPLKRVLENTDTGLRANDATKGNELLDHATVRLEELDALSQGTVDDKQTRTIETTLSTFSDQANEASDLLLAQYADNGSEGAITTLRTFTGESMASLSRLEAQLPDAARPAVVDAAKVLFAIDLQAAEVCPGCDGLGILDIPSSLISATLGRVADAEADSDGVESTTAVPSATSPTKGPKGNGAKGANGGDTGKAASPSGPATAADPGTAAVPGGGLLDGAKATGGPAGTKTVPSGSGGPLDALGKVLTGKGQTTGTTSSTTSGTSGTGGTGGTGGTAVPTGPLPTLGEVVQNTLDDVTTLTGTLLDPLTP